MAGLAHTVQGLRPRFKAQSYLLPPWLAMQPGKARGFVRILEPSSTALNPSLVLDAAEVQWLSLGCLSGHAGGVFISSCNSSPRSHQRCGSMAAVVINKQVVAELYLPPGCSAPDQWGSLLRAPDPHTRADSSVDVSNIGGVMSGKSAAAFAGLLDAAVPILNLRQYSLQAVQMVPHQQQKHQQKQSDHGPDASLDYYCIEHCDVLSAVEATTAALSLGPSALMNGTSSARAPAAASGSQLTAARQSWHQVCVAVQTALSAATARKVAEVAAADAAAGSSTDKSGCNNSSRCLKLSEDDQSEVLAALIRQLPDLAPQLQILILPVVLPGGR
eukprot:gene4148-4397_t